MSRRTGKQFFAPTKLPLKVGRAGRSFEDFSGPFRIFCPGKNALQARSFRAPSRHNMDRSRIVVALAMAFAVLATLLSIAGIASRSSDSPFSASSDSFFSGGRSGIALIEIDGVIQDGYSSTGGATGADLIVERLQQCRDNPGVRAVLLSINSPGGTVGATKKIYDAVMELRRQKNVVASISDIAASGGYYVASAADGIFAFEGSIIGSIGVIMLRPNISGFLNQYGIRVEALHAGRFKDSSYPFRELTEEERQMYNRILDDSYRQFIRDVSLGRDVSESTVNDWAEGRIFSGSQARDLRMITGLGGREAAIAWLKNEKLKTTDELEILRPEPNFWEEILRGSPLGGGMRETTAWTQVLHGPVLYLYTGGPGIAGDLIRELVR